MTKSKNIKYKNSNWIIKKRLFLFAILFFALFSFTLISPVFAQDTSGGGTGSGTGDPTNPNPPNPTGFCNIATDPGAQGPRIGNYLNYVTCIISKYKGNH